MTVIFIVAGVVLGALHAGLLARGAARAPNPLSLGARLLLVAGALLVAAHAGHLLAMALGWGIGFASGAIVAYRRLR